MRRRSKRNIIDNQSNFNFENFAEKELVDKFSLWMYRILIKLNSINEFADNDCYFRDESLAYFLGLESFIDNEDKTRSDLIKFIDIKLKKLEARKKITTLNTLKSNIDAISNVTTLNQYEKDILEFSILLNQYDILQTCTDYLGSDLNGNHTKRALSIILDIPMKNINEIFRSDSKLTKSALLTIDPKNNHNLKYKLDFITDLFPSKMIEDKDDIKTILKEVISECNSSDLSLNDYEHINQELELLIPYLKDSIKQNKKGVNVLLYGVAGTGKTELSKVIAKELNVTLHEISYSDENDEPIEGKNRLKAYKFAQSLFENSNSILMFDEVEDIFNSGNIFDNKQRNKAWINRSLENNSIPTIWITNNANEIDDAIIRRFDLSIEVPIPSKSKRFEILNKYSNNQFSSEIISKLSKNENIAPAIVSRAANIASNTVTKNKDEVFEMIINNTLKAQGYRINDKEDLSSKLPNSYNPNFINSSVDLENLAIGIKDNPNARICLYGAAGTGKSAYGKYLAEILDKPLILKKGSDLISMYVGGTEKNIARAFEEVKEEKGVLVFDEVDSFLSSRENASKSWEVTQVNEMLVQMENFDGIFIATTNLMDNLDKASLRRFDLKLEFGYLTSNQAFDLFKLECENLNIEVSSSIEHKIKNLDMLAPGDFAAVIRQNRFMPIKDDKDFYERLKEEVEVKSIDSNKSMGFVA